MSIGGDSYDLAGNGGSLSSARYDPPRAGLIFMILPRVEPNILATVLMRESETLSIIINAADDSRYFALLQSGETCTSDWERVIHRRFQ